MGDVDAHDRETFAAMLVRKFGSFKSPPWMDLEALPELRWSDGTPAPIRRPLLGWLRSCVDAEEPGDLVSIANLFGRRSISQFVWAMVNQWEIAGAPGRYKWALAVAATFDVESAPRELAQRIRRWHGVERKYQRGLAALDLLGSLGTHAAIHQVDLIAVAGKREPLRARSELILDEVARRRGILKPILSCEVFPDYGFARNGRKRFTGGSGFIEARLSDDLEIRLFDETNRPQKTFSRPRKGSVHEANDAAPEDFKEIKRELKESRTLLALRLETALVERARWRREQWIFPNRPVHRALGRKLMWGAYSRDDLSFTFRIAEDGTLADVNDRETWIPADATIGIPHPLEFESSALSAWQNLFRDYAITPLVDQFDRPVFSPLAAEREETFIARFFGRNVLASSLQRILARHGWSTALGHGAPRAEQAVHWRRFQRADISALLIHSPIQYRGLVDDQPVQLGQLAFLRGSFRDLRTSTNDPSTWLKIGEVDAVAFSETIRGLVDLTSAANA